VSEAGPREIPQNWASTELSNIAEINPSLERCIVSDDVPVDFVPMRAVEPEGGGLLRPEVSTYGKVKKGYTAFVPGDVIMAKITPCMENGKTCVVPKLPGAACFGSTEFHVLRAEGGIEARWIANYLLQHSTRHAAQRQMAGGVGQMRVPSVFLERLAVPLPPASEQARILDTLDELQSDLDAGVAALERVRAKLKHYRAAVLKAAVEGALTVEWRRQHPLTESATLLLSRILTERRRRLEVAQLARFKATGKSPPKDWKAKYPEPSAPDTADLPPLAEGWRWVSLDQIAAIAGGVTKGQRFSDKDVTREVAYLRVANVQRGYLDLTEMKQIRAMESDIEALRLFPGDVLFNEGGDRDKLGRGWIWEGQIEECIHQNHVFRARLYLQDVKPKLVSWSGNSYGQRWFMRTGKQSVNLASINMTVLRSFPVPLAPVAEQEVIVEAVEDQLSVIDHLEGDVEAKLKSAQALRQCILHHAFTGQLVPQDPNDEPAIELLKRIAAERAERAQQASGARRLKSTTKELRIRAANR
jgi:type I restriction enzyme S subunit